MSGPPEFVRKTLSDKDVYIVNGVSGSNVSAQIEYKDVKSPAVIKLEMLSKGQILVPRWLVNNLENNIKKTKTRSL